MLAVECPLGSRCMDGLDPAMDLAHLIGDNLSQQQHSYWLSFYAYIELLTYIDISNDMGIEFSMKFELP